MSERVHEGQTFKKKLNHDVIGGVAITDLDRLATVPSGTYVQARFSPRGELYTKFDDEITVNSGGSVSVAPPALVVGSVSPLSLEPDGDLRTTVTDAQTTDGGAAPTDVVQVGGRVETVTPNPANNTLTSLSLDSYNGIRARIDRVQGTPGSNLPGEVLMQGQCAESTVPIVGADGAPVRPWYDLYGRPTLRADDLSSASLTATVLNPTPAIVHGPTGNETLTDVGDQTSSKEASLYKLHSFQIVYASYESPAVFRILGSMDNSDFGALALEDNDTTGSTDNLAVTGADAQIAAAGTYVIHTKPVKVKWVRLEWSDGGSPPAAAATVNYMGGN